MHKGSYSTHYVSTTVPKSDGSSDSSDVEIFLDRFAAGIRPNLDEGFHMKPLDVVAESRRSFRIQRLDILRGRLIQLARPKGNWRSSISILSIFNTLKFDRDGWRR